MIIGYNQPTVNCNKTGGLHFISCRSCTIMGITWNECGTMKESAIAGLKFESSSAVTIENCSFLHSIGQAVVLSNILGHVKINHCKFMNNNYYSGHGTAIHYSSNNNNMHSQLVFTIGKCNFTNMGGASIFYAEDSERLLHDDFVISNSCFCDNQGIPLYLSHLNLYIKGEILFNGNTAENGSGIYASDHSNITFCNNSITKFNHNLASNSGGAIYAINYTNVLF